ncbi:MAG: hypothetical protein M3137_01950, partial [Actinomycetota bacterium]|nr:hypothetical protein [Actinomycetota bacterium]
PQVTPVAGYLGRPEGGALPAAEHAMVAVRHEDGAPTVVFACAGTGLLMAWSLTAVVSRRRAQTRISLARAVPTGGHLRDGYR